MPEREGKVTVPRVRAMKAAGEKVAMVTAYDALTARLVDEAGVDAILVGDSLAMTVLGHETTLPVTMDEMLHHTKAVSRGAKSALIVGDMPFGSYQGSVEEAVQNAARFLKEAGADAVKVEGGRRVVPHVSRMTAVGIPVLGHLGMTPQSVRQYGGFRVQGRGQGEQEAMIQDAKALEEAGVFALVLEAIPASVAQAVTRAVSVPTIGIGAGAGCDGQVLVIHDLLGLTDDFQPKFVKRYANMADQVRQAVGAYCADVKEGRYPDREHSYE